jgi:hypothetical protein
LHHGTQSQAKARFFGDATARENQKTAPTDFSCLSLGTETATIVDQTVTSRETNLVRRYKLGSVEPFSASYNDNLNKFRAEAAKGWTEFNPAYSYAGLKVVTHAGPLTGARLPIVIGRSALMSLRRCESPGIAALSADAAPTAIIGCPHMESCGSQET